MNLFAKVRNRLAGIVLGSQLHNHGVLCSGKTYVKAAKSAKVEIKNSLSLGGNSISFGARPSMLRLDENARLVVNGSAKFCYGADIILFPNSCFEIGKSFINSDCKIRCHKSIRIGDGCVISHDFTVMDSDAHYLNGDNHTAPVVIEDRVWIGTRVTVLSGVTVGEGAIIAANSLVINDILPHTLVGGSPARVLKENVEWKA